METKDIIIITLLVLITLLIALIVNTRKTHSTHLLGPMQDCCNADESGEAFGYERIEEIRGIIRAKRRVPLNYIYGYAIDFRHIEEMYKDICSYNNSCNQYGLKEIVGVRIYEGISERLINKELKKKADLVLIPYLKGEEGKHCKDLYLVDETNFHSELVLPKMYSHLRPCPKLCGDESLNIV